MSLKKIPKRINEIIKNLKFSKNNVFDYENDQNFNQKSYINLD